MKAKPLTRNASSPIERAGPLWCQEVNSAEPFYSSESSREGWLALVELDLQAFEIAIEGERLSFETVEHGSRIGPEVQSMA